MIQIKLYNDYVSQFFMYFQIPGITGQILVLANKIRENQYDFDFKPEDWLGYDDNDIDSGHFYL